MWNRLVATEDSPTLTLQRLVLGGVMLPHGAQKLLGWFGGYGFWGTTDFMTTQMHIPAPIVILVILSEFFGSLLLLSGLLTRFAALGCAAVMAGAALTAHLPHGFFMNWFGAQKGEGFEFHLLAIALALPLVWKGAGAFSVDAWLSARGRGEHSATGVHVFSA